MSEVTARLAACADTAAVAAELHASLPTLAASQDVQAAVAAVVEFLTASGERWVIATQSLISDLNGEKTGHDVQLELLDGLLGWAAQQPVEKNHDLLDTLLQVFQLAMTRLGDAGDGRRWLKWGDLVLTVVHKNAAQLEKQGTVEAVEGGAIGSVVSRSCVVKIAVALMNLREKVEGSDGATPDLKIVTFVWKNLAKLATAFGPTLASAGAAATTDSDKPVEDDGKEAEAFSVDELLAAAVSSVEKSVGQLLCVLDGQSDGALDLGVLKFLKLYWRAFQRLTAAFADSLECELENCVLTVVNVAASLLYAVRHSLVPATSKPGQELRAMLDQAVEITEMLAGDAEGAVNSQARQSIGTLLWFPAAEMIRAVGQRQPPEVTNVDVENSIQWGHLLILTAFAGVSGGNSVGMTDTDTPFDDTNRAVEVSQLFARYRECALNDAVSRSIEATELFTDLMLGYLFGFESVVEMQLTLLKQSLYPDWSQRIVCWEIWRELLCSSWDENLAAQTLQMLLDITQWDDDNADFVLASGVENELLELIAFVYGSMPLSLKDVCMDRVTAVIDLISNEGPGHEFNLRVASQLHLLEKLAGVHFLKEYDGPMKDEWVAKYLPMCFECCGTVLELLTADAKAPTLQRESILGMVRVLDMCLLVLRGVFDDNEPRHDDVAELSIILVRMSTEALTQVAKLSTLVGSSPMASRKRTSRSVKLEKAGYGCVGRAVETSLYLLSKLGTVLKANKNNQCVQVMKDLLAIIDSTRSSAQDESVNDSLVVTARFVNAALFDMQVAGGDMAVVWRLVLALFQKLLAATRQSATQRKLLLSVCFDALYELLAHSNVVDLPGVSLSTLLAGELKQSFQHSVSMRKLIREEIAQALETAQTRTLGVLRRSQSSRYRSFTDRFPDEPSELYAEPEEASQDASTASNKRSAEESTTAPQKRHKLTHFVSLCREIESSLSSLESDEAAANILSGKELDDATAVLHRLLAKTMMM